MKYRYNFIIEDVGKDEEILVLSGVGSTRSKETCLKGIRREITQTIREILAKSTEKNPEEIQTK